MRHKLRHLILILLMLTLGLQSSWAAVASLCLHEVEAQAASHLGHHAHAHQQADTADADAADIGDAKQTGPHADCATCHAGCGALFFPAPLAQLHLPAARVITPYQRSITLGLPERLIRPPHCFLA